MAMLSILIMAGGSGERFWPLSTPRRPKQFLAIFAEKPLIRLAFERVLPLTDASHIFISTNALQVDALKEAVPELPVQNIIIEPLFKDTAAAIGYGTMIIEKYYPGSTIAVLASDHLIQKEEAFREALLIAKEESENSKSIVVFGVLPNRPETGYGYIQVAESIVNHPTQSLSFKEKPDAETAKRYLQDGHYLWNSGMFVFTSETMMRAFKELAPSHYRILNQMGKVIQNNLGEETSKVVRPFFERFDKISIDFAIMEKAKNVVVIPVSFGWNDVGSFMAISDLYQPDSSGNVTRFAAVKTIDSNGNIIVSDDPNSKVALIGVRNSIVAVSGNNVLVCRKTDIRSIKEAVEMFGHHSS